MSRPDLSTEEGRAAYRKELRGVGRPLRLGGLGLVIAAALLILASRKEMFGIGEWGITVSYGMLAAGWALVIAAVFMRTRHHRRRLVEGL